MTPVATPTDRRFRRAHVSPGRHRGRFHVTWLLARAGLIVLCVVYGGYRGAEALLSSDALTVTNITVTGNHKLSRGEVLSLLEPLQGRNMLFVNLDEVRRTLMASPWVADASLRRELPGRVDVVITEREPVAIGRFAEGLFVIDEDGSIVDEFGPNHADLDLPLVDGLAPAGRDGRGPSVDPARAALVVRMLASLRQHPDLARDVSQIDVSDSRDAVVLLKSDTTLIRVGEDRFAERLRSYLELAKALRERVPRIDSVDLRFGDRVYVKPQPSRDLSQAVRAVAADSGVR